jgi:copper chaperone
MGVQLVFTVADMACSACADKITQAIRAIDANAIVTANPQTKLVQIETTSPADAIAQAITDAGYTLSN